MSLSVRRLAMDQKRSLVWAGKYFLITSALAIVGVGLVALGVYLAFQQTSGTIAFGIPRPTSSSLVGLVPAIIGLAIWRAGKAWAMYLTLTGAIEEELADTYDTEHVKSDIVAVLDDRLADMQQDLQSVNREIRNLKQAEDFEFPESK